MKYNSIIIGFGKGGKTIAATLAKNGEKVALIEKSNKMYGGTCINVGCIPSKSLVRSSSLSMIDKDTSLISKQDRYKQAILEKRNLVSMLRKANYNKLDTLENVDIYDGIGSFIDKNNVKVTINNSEDLILSTDKIFINTGSYSFIPSIEGIENNKYIYTSETLMDLEELPEKLVIIGGGYIGLEFASMYSGFGSKVTVVQDSNVFIPKEDRDIAESIKEVLELKGVDFIFGANTTRFDNNVVYYKKGEEEKQINSDAILIATGRRPNIKDLNVQNAGIELTSRGAIKVNEKLQTSVENIYAMGDVVGGLQFTYISLDDYRIVLSNLYNNNGKKLSERKNVPYSVFISPAFSRVGLNEDEARKAGYNIKVLKMKTAMIPKAKVLKNPNGMLKAIINQDNNQILGAMLFCEESYEMINIIKLAMDLNAEYTVLRDNIYTHPTMSEAFNDLFSL